MDSQRISVELSEKIDKIKNILSSKKVLVAFSGGMDSSLVCFLAQKFSLKVLPIFIDDPTTPTQELHQAEKISEFLKIPLRILKLNILDNPDFVSNTPNRCYYCKKQLLKELKEIAEKEDYDIVVDGTNYSDLSDTRAGLKALQESHVLSPLVEARISKLEVQKISKFFNLPSYKFSSQACLASRIPYYTKISKDLLKLIDESEQFIREIINNQEIPIRVRIHLIGSDKYLARIESNDLLYSLLNDNSMKKKIIEKFTRLGFLFVTIDLEGFISGKMNKLIESKENKII